jgi:hypothetical protein
MYFINFFAVVLEFKFPHTVSDNSDLWPPDNAVNFSDSIATSGRMVASYELGKIPKVEAMDR